MKNVWRFFVGVLVLFVLVAGGIANADDSLTLIPEPVKEPEPNLTIVFAPAPVSDSAAGTELSVSDVPDNTDEESELIGGDFDVGNTPEIDVDKNEFVGQDVEFASVFFAGGDSLEVGMMTADQSVSEAVPEPGTLVLLGLGVLGLLGFVRWKRH